MNIVNIGQSGYFDGRNPFLKWHPPKEVNFHYWSQFKGLPRLFGLPVSELNCVPTFQVDRKRALHLGQVAALALQKSLFLVAFC